MDDWQTINNRLVRNYEFPDFVSALAFVNKVSELAEQANHHPDIFLGWGKVKVELWSHDVGKITERDYDLAEQIEHEWQIK